MVYSKVREPWRTLLPVVKGLIINLTVIEIVINTMLTYPCKTIKSTWLTVHSGSKPSLLSPILADGSSHTSISDVRYEVGSPFLSMSMITCHQSLHFAVITWHQPFTRVVVMPLYFLKYFDPSQTFIGLKRCQNPESTLSIIDRSWSSSHNDYLESHTGLYVP